MAKRFGTLIVFRDDVTKEEAEQAINSLPIRKLIDQNYQYPAGPPPVREFEGEWGGPVWYLP